MRGTGSVTFKALELSRVSTHLHAAAAAPAAAGAALASGWTGRVCDAGHSRRHRDRGLPWAAAGAPRNGCQGGLGARLQGILLQVRWTSDNSEEEVPWLNDATTVCLPSTGLAAA